MSNVNFFNEDCDYIIEKNDIIAKWVLKIIHDEGMNTGDINIILCSDNYLLELNKKYLSRDNLTDVIAFDYKEGETISGDIFISIERVIENARKYKVSESAELNRVIAHGVLHLTGYQDETAYKKQKMRRLEDIYLNLL